MKLCNIYFFSALLQKLVKDGRFAKKNFDLEIPRKFREKDIMLGYHKGDSDSLDNIFSHYYGVLTPLNQWCNNL
jgi:hypothetical protein